MKNIGSLLAITGTVLMLSACSNGGGNGGGGGGGGPQVDAFITAVRGVIATSPDDTEPQSLNNFPAVTLPENTEPEAL